MEVQMIKIKEREEEVTSRGESKIKEEKVIGRRRSIGRRNSAETIGRAMQWKNDAR
jgi:hypothetical protein